MATKDWKKRKGWLGGGILYDNKIFGSIQIIEKTVIISEGDNHEVREFKSRSQAIAFAKDYMREN